ncbi:hypothetical protein SAMN05421810_109147 [Amycolatopsis arida]|uniref:Uncharacterized protein n=1 Tax=Amycolatopsis arida TaxID=587909 RepID=A0A1I5ZFA3_9PSEU|nr:hypothetical protein CLV69_109146 [Amycolatopsis arida]SFQ55199.1 hypothetical protein SAMN05421810_109147 [Amycolatopsis arida]
MSLLGSVNRVIDKSAEVAARRVRTRAKVVLTTCPPPDRCIRCNRRCEPSGFSVSWCPNRPACVRIASYYIR